MESEGIEHRAAQAHRAGTGPDPYRAVHIYDGNGQPVADPVPLDGSGTPIEPGGNYAYAEYDGYLPVDWSNITF